MKIQSVVAAAVAAAMVSACAAPPVTVPRAEVRRDVKAIAADVSGDKYSDTGNLGARGADEGASKGAAQGASAALRSGGNPIISLLLAPLAAGVGAAAGASAAKPAEVVDVTRASLRKAIIETDFADQLRAKLTAMGAGPVKLVGVTVGPGSAAAAAGKPETASEHVLTLEYKLGLIADGAVNPDVGVFLIVKGQLMAMERRQVLHTNTWGFCGERRNFVDASAEESAFLRREIERAATVVAEAIVFDLFVSNEPRPISKLPLCMDYANLPSGIGKEQKDVPAVINAPAGMEQRS